MGPREGRKAVAVHAPKGLNRAAGWGSGRSPEESEEG